MVIQTTRLVRYGRNERVEGRPPCLSLAGDSEVLIHGCARDTVCIILAILMFVRLIRDRAYFPFSSVFLSTHTDGGWRV